MSFDRNNLVAYQIFVERSIVIVDLLSCLRLWPVRVLALHVHRDDYSRTYVVYVTVLTTLTVTSTHKLTILLLMMIR